MKQLTTVRDFHPLPHRLLGDNDTTLSTPSQVFPSDYVISLTAFLDPRRFILCGRRDSNSHGRNAHQPLKLACLPFHHCRVLWEERDSNPLTARPIRRFVFRADLQSAAVIFPLFVLPARFELAISTLRG